MPSCHLQTVHGLALVFCNVFLELLFYVYQGNLTRYPVGTFAEIEDNKNNIIYFFLALSKLNSALKAETSEEEHMLALLKLLKYIDARSQGMPVVLPLIGRFLSRTNISEEYFNGNSSAYENEKRVSPWGYSYRR